jgi:uncharacterized lipoprotein YehR (DUF1307 family)
MIKLSVFLIISTFSLILNSCEKNSESQTFCASCTVKMIISYNFDDGKPIISETKVDQCDLTEDAYSEMLKTGNATTTITKDDLEVTTKMITTCEKN